MKPSSRARAGQWASLAKVIWYAAGTMGGGDRARQVIIDSFKVVCICNKVARGTIERAIAAGAGSVEEVRRRTRAAGGPCGAKRCGPAIARMIARR